MRAALLREFNTPLSVETVQQLGLSAGRVLVATKASPFCSTDVTSVHGKLGKRPPTILGHAAAGEVLAIGEGVTDVAVGQRVVIPGTPECGRCFYCVHGHPDQCSELFDIGGIYPDVAVTDDGQRVSAAGCVGAYADTLNVSMHQVFPVETDLGYDVLSLLGCGITTGVGAVLNVAQVEPGQSVAVIGAGHLGLWAIQAARIAGAAHIISVDPHAARRKIALDVGATSTIDPDEHSSVAAIRDLTHGRGADVVIECAGPPRAQRDALLSSRRAGTVVYTGVAEAVSEIALPQIPLSVQSRRVLGCQNGNVSMRRDLPKFIDFIERGDLLPDPIITERYALDNINHALQRSETLEDISGVIVF